MIVFSCDLIFKREKKRKKFIQQQKTKKQLHPFYLLMESADLDNFLNLGSFFFNEFKNSYLINNHKITREKKRTKFNANTKKNIQ